MLQVNNTENVWSVIKMRCNTVTAALESDSPFSHSYMLLYIEKWSAGRDLEIFSTWNKLIWYKLALDMMNPLVVFLAFQNC